MIFKKIIATIAAFLLLTSQVYAAAAKPIVIDKFAGLNRSSVADKIKDTEFTRFDNVVIDNENLTAVKGRVKLNTTALSNTTTNGFWYYENQAGSTKKLVRFENTALASYDADGTNRASLNTGLTNEEHNAVQIGDALYITSTTDGLYKWTGSGAAAAVGSVSAPSTVDFSATTGVGGMTPGEAVLVAPNLTVSSACAESPNTTATGCVYLGSSFDAGGTTVTSDDGTLETAYTSTAYSYKVTKYSSVWGIESEASTVDTAALAGDSYFTWSGTSCTPCDSAAPYDTYAYSCCSDIQYTTGGRQTRTTGTLTTAPSAPFDGYRVYRTVAGGVDYFLLGYQTTGAYTDGKPDVSLQQAFDTTLDTIAPPKGRYIAEYKGTIFIASGTTLYFTRLPVQNATDMDTYWLASDKIDTGAKEIITGLKTTANSLLIFTSNRVMELSGFGVGSFRLRVLYEGVGATSGRTIVTDNNGDVIFFSGSKGVYKLRVGQASIDNKTGTVMDTNRKELERVSHPSLSEVFTGSDSQIALTISDFTSSHAYYDVDEDRYFLYTGSDCFILDGVTNTWSHLPATKMGSSLYRKSPNGAGQGVLIDTLGFMFNNWTTYANGVMTGTVTGAVSSSGNTTLTCSTCTFTTTGSGLAGVWVAVVSSVTGDLAYRQITSNTATELTVGTAWTVNPAVGEVFYVGYVIPEVTTKPFSVLPPPGKTSTRDFWLTFQPAAATQLLYVYAFINKATSAYSAVTIDMSDANSIKKVNMPMSGYWIGYQFRSYLYNTSSSVTNPMNILSFVFKAEGIEEL